MTSTLQDTQLMRNTLFREVYKNAWLKVMLVGSKKKDKFWIVFCVHDDTNAYLEAYIDNKLAATHNPHWFLSLNNTIHITSSICPQDEEYEFVITLQTTIIRLSAPSWQLMTDWVETLRRKLFEMKVLAPKENVYSKLPEIKNISLLPTRDPTSPLPPPPVNPAETAVPSGVEPVHINANLNSSPADEAIQLDEASGVSSHYEYLCPNNECSSLVIADNKPVQHQIKERKIAHRSASNCDRHRFQIMHVISHPVAEQIVEQPMNRRRSSSLSETVSGRNTSASTQLPLRTQQVLQLRKEITHLAGIRLRLKRRDCINSIALVDINGSVWVAGWKQKEHPMLYNALHIGDKLVSVQGVVVQRASDAHRLLSSPSGIQIDLVIKRLPYSQVFAIRREMDGQSLGIVQEEGTAVIKEVINDGLAARHGVPLKAQTSDGLSLTNWVLTEINGRPLNLFFKDNEIRDRLNSVGRDISILIQPLDFIKQLKKQLKSVRNYKEYILQ